MVDPGLPPVVARLIANHISSIAQLEMLLLLRTRAEALSADVVGRTLGIAEAWAAAELRRLAGRGIVVQETEPDAPEPLYRFRPETPELVAAFDGLADAYRHRRVTVITAICERPATTVQVFADAFRLRKD